MRARAPEISYTAFYEYDSQPFIGHVNIVSPTSTEIGDFTYSVQYIVDPQFDLTKFTSENATCIWDRVKITEGGVSKEETTVKKTETIWFKAEYEYDSNSFDSSDGLLYLNGELMEWSSSNQRWEKEYRSDSPETMTFQITGIRDDTYELTDFNDEAGEQSIEWKEAGIPGFPFHSILLGLITALLFLLFSRKY
jgi:hypothetical protein